MLCLYSCQIPDLKKQNFMSILGPGLLFASTAIGVSHLVQSTRAGANFGLNALLIIVLANILKYPFFEFGTRYAAATKTSLIEGYRRLGLVPSILYFLIALIGMVVVTSAVGKVTEAFTENLTGLNEVFSVKYATLLMIYISAGIVLWVGKYQFLDKLIKYLGVIMVLTTVVSFTLAMVNGKKGEFPLFGFQSEVQYENFLLFLVPLMGWMPTAVDLSTWNSLWTVEKIKLNNGVSKVSLFIKEFNLGYWLTAVLAIMFLLLGAFMMYGTGEEFPNSAPKFAAKVVSLYTENIGAWSIWIVGPATFCIMYGTFITVLDGYTRSLKDSVRYTFKWNLEYRWVLIVCWVVSFVIITQAQSFKTIVDIATISSFLVAPIIAIMNQILVSKKYFKTNSPSLFKRVLGVIGIVYLIGFTLYYILQL